jgi:pyridoxine 5-phosphate synthase
VSLFVEPERRQLEAAIAVGAPVVELHTGSYCDAYFGSAERFESERRRIEKAAYDAAALGLEVHAGHGLTYDTVGPVARMLPIIELNIGHFIIGEAIFVGLEEAIFGMRERMDEARAEAMAAAS